MSSFLIILIKLVGVTAQALNLLIIVSIVLSYFMSPYHAVRQAVDSVVEPMLMPIRRIVPLVGMFDFSPLILIVLVQVLAGALTNLLVALM